MSLVGKIGKMIDMADYSALSRYKNQLSEYAWHGKKDFFRVKHHQNQRKILELEALYRDLDQPQTFSSERERIKNLVRIRMHNRINIDGILDDILRTI
jgi:hypothetical protein